MSRIYMKKNWFSLYFKNTKERIQLFMKNSRSTTNPLHEIYTNLLWAWSCDSFHVLNFTSNSKCGSLPLICRIVLFDICKEQINDAENPISLHSWRQVAVATLIADVSYLLCAHCKEMSSIGECFLDRHLSVAITCKILVWSTCGSKRNIRFKQMWDCSRKRAQYPFSLHKIMCQVVYQSSYKTMSKDLTGKIRLCMGLPCFGNAAAKLSYS